MTTNILAFDFGKSSIRSIVGVYDSGKFSTYDLGRYPTEHLMTDDHVYLDIGLYTRAMTAGLLDAAKQFGKIASVGVDFWGGSFALLDSDGKLIRYPFHYSDNVFNLNRNILDRYISDEEIYINYEGGATTSSISMLLALREALPEDFDRARTLLMMPDFLAYLLSGAVACEQTILSSGGLSTAYKQWNSKLFQRLGIPLGLFPDNIVAPGYSHSLLPVFSSMHKNLFDTVFIRVASHDTASAIATIPIKDGCAYISSGSTSIMGIIMDEPVLTKQTYNLRLYNEITGDGKVRLLRNINGMLIQNDCVRDWKKKGIQIELSELDQEAKRVPLFKFMINPSNGAFHVSEDMPSTIALYCKDTGQPVPESPAEILAAINIGLAMEYRYTIEAIRDLAISNVHTIYMVGGGTGNAPLCQYTADATACRVIVGNKEATSTGNLLLQALTLGLLSDYSEIAAIDSALFPGIEYFPENTQDWDKAYERYKVLPR